MESFCENIYTIIVLEKDFSTDQLDKTANVFGKVVYDNSPDPEVKYVSW